MRPILARKNRYYRDPLFRKRLFPPPKSAVPPGRPAKRPAVAPQSPAKPNPATAPPDLGLEGSVARAEPLKAETPVRDEGEALTHTAIAGGAGASDARGDARRSRSARQLDA